MRLHIVRHAKAAQKEHKQKDAARSLNKRGMRDATNMAAHLARQGIRPDWLIASDSQRTKQTAALLCAGLGLDSNTLHIDQRLYLASADALMAVLRETPTDYREIMLVGHNPGVTDLIALLTGVALVEGLPTMAVATLELAAGNWRELLARCGTLSSCIAPKLLPESISA